MFNYRYMYEQCHIVDVLIMLLRNEHAHTYRLFEVAVGTLANLCSTDEQIALTFAKVCFCRSTHLIIN